MAAERLGNCLRTGDTVIHPNAHPATRVAGRFGGDEFTVCVSELSNVEGATAVADRIRAAFASPFQVDGRELFVTASTGVSIYPYDGTDADTLLKHADAAMYDAKTKGRNKQALYRPSMSAKASERLSLSGDLRRAFERDEFQVFYQPKVEVSTRRVVGAEALMRWQHPTRGWVAPPEFMGFAEEIGLGPQIGDWLLQTTLSHIRDWSGNGGQPPPIALNLSDTQFQVSGLLERITQTLGEYRVDARCIEFEITEDVIIQSRLAARELLAGLKALGIRTAIDDFGTGQSALSTLRGLPVDALKIDGSFVRDLDVSQTARAIAASIIDIGHHLGMIVIAEGIETEQQLETLNSMGCDQAQGFLFSRGLPAGEFELFLAETGRATGASRAGGTGASASSAPYLH
jgi:EAL domain-containing protein (putative c-di-GMP-specific phosphodiesterase class I)